MSTEHRIRPGIVFRLSRELGSLPDSLQLYNLEWGLLLAITGEHTVAQIGDHFGLATAERDAAFRRLQQLGLIEEQPVSFAEYVRASATIADHEPRTLARFLRSGMALAGTQEEPSRPDPASAGETSATGRSAVTGPGPRGVVRSQRQDPPLRPTLPADEPSLADLPVDSHTRAIPTGSLAMLAFEPLAEPAAAEEPAVHPTSPAPNGAETATSTTSAPPANELRSSATHGVMNGDSGARRLSLKALMQVILDRAPDLDSGQLDIYRVFIRVDTRLLKRHGIHTLRFTEDHQIADPELEAAIASSLEKTLGLSIPESVFV